MNNQVTSTTALATSTPLPHGVARALHSELGSEERIQWMAQPRPWRAVRASVGAVLFGIPWTAFAVFWSWGAAQGSLLFALWGVPFIGVGVYMLASPLLAYRDALQSVYAVTNERVLVIQSKARETSVRSFAPQNISNLERRERPDGSGDLVLVKRSERDSDGDKRQVEDALLGVPDVREAERCVRRLITDAVTAPASS